MQVLYRYLWGRLKFSCRGSCRVQPAKRPALFVLLAYALCLHPARAAGREPATVTGRVFDVYHRPVRSARVVPMERRIESGKLRLTPGTPQASVDDAGMYRLSLPPGRYLLAVIPPPNALDFAAVFPAYLGDIVDPEKAPSIEVRAGELRPFVDFLLLEVEPHRLTGEVDGIPAGWQASAVAISLYAATGYTGPLRTVLADTRGHFFFDRIPAGSYEVKAAGPVNGLSGLDPKIGASPWYGSVHLDARAPEIGGIRIHLRAAAR